MKTCYVNVESRAIADLVPPGELYDAWTITRINVPAASRGRGHARELLQRICWDADDEGVKLALEVAPSDGLPYDLLVAWYERYGFRWSDYGYMVRRPITAEQR